MIQVKRLLYKHKITKERKKKGNTLKKKNDRSIRKMLKKPKSMQTDKQKKERNFSIVSEKG